MTESLFWYDLETTGTDPARDRVLQFAGVRTDLDLRPTEPPVNLLCHPGDDVLPDPEAITVTGINMDTIVAEGRRERDFAAAIHAEFARPGTCVLGFNSLRFDDEFVRYLFYRNFYDPYAREWQGGNSRWDVIDLFRMAQALRPDGFTWPRDEAGVPTFRLEALAAANGVEHAQAHDAVSDVLATVATVSRLRDAQPRLYDYLFGLRGKKSVIAQLYPLGKHPVIHVSSMYPARDNCIAVVLPLCSHPTNSNGVICYDLASEPDELLTLGEEALRRRLFTRRDELGENEPRIPLKTIHVNRCPAIAPLKTLQAEDAERLGIDLSMCHANMTRLQQASGLTEKVQDAFAGQTFAESGDPDLMLYEGGFFSSRDRAAMAELRDADAEALRHLNSGHDDARLPEMLFRYRARNFPASLTAAEHDRWNEFCREQWQGGAVVSTRLERIDTLLAEGRGETCLPALRAFIEARWADVGADVRPDVGSDGAGA